MACAGCQTGFYDCVGLDNERVTDFLVAHGIFKQYINCPSCDAVLPLVKNRLVFRCQALRQLVAKKKEKELQQNIIGTGRHIF